MRVLAYLLSFLLALPCALFALWVLVIGHVIETRNVFKLVYQFLVAFGWGVPVLFLGVAALVAAGFLPYARTARACLLLAVDLAACVVIFASPAAPKSPAETVFLLPTVLSGVLAGLLVSGRL